MSLLFPYLVKVSIILALAYVIYLLVFRRSTFHQYNRFYLLGSVVLSFIAPLISFELSSSSALYSYTLPVMEFNHIGEVSRVATNASSISSLLTNLYFAVASFFLLRLVLTLSSLVQSWKGLEKRVLDDTLILISKENSVAYSFFNRIVLPNGFNENSLQDDLVLQHEKIHVSQKHSWDVIFLELCKVILWFNPFIYWLKNEVTAQHEYFIDRDLTERETNTQVYGELIINQSLCANGFQLCNAFNNSLTKNRITMMTKQPNKKSNRFNYLFVLPPLMVLCFLVACQKDTNDSEIRSIDEAIHQQVELMPKFVGGDAAMFKYIGSQLKYPNEARENEIEGLVVLGFVVEKDGSISNVEIVKGIGAGCNEEAIRVVADMPKWMPGIDNVTGQPVRVSYKLPFRFKLE